MWTILNRFQIPDYRNAVIVAKNPRAARRATSYAERLRLAIAVIHGEVKVCSQFIIMVEYKAEIIVSKPHRKVFFVT